jgi:phosphatidylglycerophosphatase A
MNDKKLSLTDNILLNTATLWIAGRGPKAPGTWGSLVAMLLAPFAFLPLSMGYRGIALVAVFVLGSFAASRAEDLLGQKDPGCVVIDELLGLWITYLFFPQLSPLMLFIGFVLFRIFDIAKPWPIHASETWLPGGWSVMIDDVIGGIYAGICLGLLNLII